MEPMGYTERDYRKSAYVIMELWKLEVLCWKLWLCVYGSITSPKICSWQVEDPEELMVYFPSELEGLRTRKPNGIVPVQSLAGWK